MRNFSINAIVFICGIILGVVFNFADTKRSYKAAKELVVLQADLIEEISTHCWEEHGCECSWYDGDFNDIQDSLFNEINK